MVEYFCLGNFRSIVTLVTSTGSHTFHFDRILVGKVFSYELLLSVFTYAFLCFVYSLGHFLVV